VDNPPPLGGANVIPLSCRDRVELDFTSASPLQPDDAILLLDGVDRSVAVCANDVVAPSDPNGARHGFPYGDLLDPGGDPTDPSDDCNAEFVLFSRHHRLLPVSYGAGDFVPALAPGEGSVYTIAVTSAPPPEAVAVHVRLASPSFAATAAAGQAAAQALFTDNRTGMHFQWNDQGAVSNLGPDPCEPSTSQYSSGTLNVYWVDPAFLASVPSAETRGHACGDELDVVFVLGDGTTPVTELAHQLGHAFGLEGLDAAGTDPSEFLVGELTTNLMYEDGSVTELESRDRFTLGQVFRMYFVDSYLNRRLGWTQRCASGAGPSCPERSLDIRR
jgi:hypothetical protein